MPTTKSEKKKSTLVLNLRVEYTDVSNILEELEQIKEVVEQARGTGAVSGTIEANGTVIGDVD